MMPDSATQPPLEFHLEPFGQQPSLWDLYTQLTFCYNLANDCSKDSIIETLTQGLQKVTSDFPWIAGQVVKRRDPSHTRPDYYIIEAYERTPKFIVRDLSAVLPGFDIYTACSFPASLLDENVLAPRNTKPGSDEEDPKPVFLVQATFVRAGLLLTFVAQHGTMDIVGQGEVVRLFSKACRGAPVADDELVWGNRDRRTIVPLLSGAERRNGQEGTKQAAQELDLPRSDLDKVENTPHTNVWAYFSFSASSLRTLKSKATSTKPATTNFISTDDALSAFIWQYVTRSRMPRFPAASRTTSTFARTVDVRRYLNIPATYPGNLATKTFTTLTFDQLVNEPLGAIASLLRRGIDPETSDLAYETRKSATALISPSEKPASSKRSRDLSRDVAFSSWAKLEYCYELDFNLGLGGPVAVRRPTFATDDGGPMEGVVYLMPKKGNGEIVVMVCLREEDMRRLRADEEWNKCAEYIG